MFQRLKPLLFSVSVAAAAAGGACATMRPMPPLPDLRFLTTAAADSQRLALLHDSLIVTDATDAVAPPVLSTRPKGTYPQLARDAGEQGWVALQFVVGTDGSVEPGTLLVLKASSPVLVQSALETIRAAHFAPGRQRGGAPTRVLGRLFVTYGQKAKKAS